MKRQVLLSVLAAIVIFAVSTNVQAGMFGRLSAVHGCSPCEAAACEPCTPPACDPCEAACNPCEASCDSCYDPCGRKPFRPFGGFFLRMKNKLAYKGCGACGPCDAACNACEPACEPVACDPCEPACSPCDVACDPCCDPCGKKPFRPFGGFFANLKYKFKSSCNPCNPCEPACEPCAPCDPCTACK